MIHERKRPDWGIRAYKYRSYPLELPEAMWSEAHAMRETWNAMTGRFHETRERLAPVKERIAVLKAKKPLKTLLAKEGYRWLLGSANELSKAFNVVMKQLETELRIRALDIQDFVDATGQVTVDKLEALPVEIRGLLFVLKAMELFKELMQKIENINLERTAEKLPRLDDTMTIMGKVIQAELATIEVIPLEITKALERLGFSFKDVCDPNLNQILESPTKGSPAELREKEQLEAQLKNEWQLFWEWVRAIIADQESAIGWENRDALLGKFQRTCRMMGKRTPNGILHGGPRIQHRLTSVCLLKRFTGGGIPWDKWKSYQGAKMSVETSNGRDIMKMRLRNGVLIAQVEINEHDRGSTGRYRKRREPELGAVVKEVKWTGQRSVFGWKEWYTIVTVEEPPCTRVTTGRVAGLDLGWYKIDDDWLRLGYLVDSDGNRVEFRLPLNYEAKLDRRNARIGRSARLMRRAEVSGLDTTIAELVEQAKAQLRATLPKRLPVEISESLRGLTKMRQAGLVRLLRLFEVQGFSADCQKILRDWLEQNDRLRRQKQAFLDRANRRRDILYGCIAKFLTTRYDILYWESDLNLRSMAEDADDYAIKAAAERRTWASLHLLTQKIKNVAARNGCELKGKAKDTTRLCWRDNSVILTGPERFRRCEQGHICDQDENAAINLLKQWDGFTQAEGLFDHFAGLRKFKNRDRLQVIDFPVPLRAGAVEIQS